MRIRIRIFYMFLWVCFATLSIAQNRSYVGTWKLDTSQSDFGTDPPPQSVTLTLEKDSPKLGSFHVSLIGHNGKAMSYSWSGPMDGTMHPVTDANGKTLANESLKKQSDGTVLRHAEDPSDGSSFDAVSRIAADGNTMFDEITERTKDGKQTKQKYVFRRAGAAGPGNRPELQ